MNDGENEGALDLPVYEEGPEEEVEIELTEDDLSDIDIEHEEEPEAEPEAEAEAEEAEEEPEPEEQPRRRSPDKRISELARRAQEAERRAQEYEAQLRQEAELRRQSDMAMMTHYENNLKTQASITRSELQSAKTLGDTEKEIELQQQLFQLQSSLSEVESWKASQAQAQQQQQAQPQPAQQQQQQQKVTLEPRTQQWIQKNDWFQPQSATFDQEMHEEATIYARRIERRYRSEGRGDEIGGVEYFAEIDRHMRNEFPDAFAEQATPKKATPQMSRNSPVAPVSRTGNPGQPARPSKTVKLSAEERKMAHSLAASGAIKGKNGGRVTPQEAERIYAIQKMNRR